MSPFHRFWFFLVTLLLAPVVSLASEQVTIGVPLPLSGKSMQDGRMMKDSFEMAMETINAKGGIDGRPLQLVFADDRGSESTGKEVIRRLVLDSRVTMLVGGHTSAPTYAMAKVADKMDVPFLICTASADRITQKGWKNIFRLNPPVSEYTGGLEDFLVKNIHPGSMSIIYENSMFGINAATHMMGFCQDSGIDIRATIGYAQKEVAPSYFRSVLAFQTQSPPDVLYMISRLDDGVAMVKAVRELGLDALLCGGAAGFTSEAFIKRAGRAANHLVTATLWSHQLPYPGAKAYHDRFLKRYSYAPDYHGAEAYSALLVAADALRRAKSLTPAHIRKSLSETYMKTPFGPVKFYTYGDFERQNTVRTLVLQIIDGKFEVIWPLDVATARFSP